MPTERNPSGRLAAEPAGEGRLPSADLTRGYLKAENDECEEMTC